MAVSDYYVKSMLTGRSSIFTDEDGEIEILDSDVASGTFEIVAVTAEGIEAESAGLDPSHTTIRLWGADALGNEWHEITGAVFDSDGGTIGFTEDESTRANAPTQFYKVTIEVDEIFE